MIQVREASTIAGQNETSVLREYQMRSTVGRFFVPFRRGFEILNLNYLSTGLQLWVRQNESADNDVVYREIVVLAASDGLVMRDDMSLLGTIQDSFGGAKVLSIVLMSPVDLKTPDFQMPIISMVAPDTIVIRGDQTAAIVAPTDITVNANSLAGANQVYSVMAVVYDAATNETTVTIDTGTSTIPADPGNDGYVLLGTVVEA